jgi:two-component system chemotaxis response regulator CheY
MGRSAITEPQMRAVAQPSRLVTPMAPPRARQCLIVDDSRVVRKVSRSIVEKHGYQVIEAENGAEALERCRAAMPDLVLLDWDMPVMTGLEFIKALRAIESALQPKAMFCTSKSGAHDIHLGISAGADEYITKPFDEATMTAKLLSLGAI